MTVIMEWTAGHATAIHLYAVTFRCLTGSDLRFDFGKKVNSCFLLLLILLLCFLLYVRSHSRRKDILSPCVRIMLRDGMTQDGYM